MNILSIYLLYMIRLFVSLLTFVMVFSSNFVAFAQTEAPAQDFIQSSSTPVENIPSIVEELPQGQLACFDYYRFGSVQAELTATVAQTVPGAEVTFKGNIINENDYPLIDGTLSVKIFRRDETVFAEGDGNPVVDQFTIEEGITLKAKDTKEASFTWKIPNNALGGEYYAAYFYTTSKRYNLMGLSFTDDVIGNQAPFLVTSDSDIQLIELSKVNTAINNKNHNFAAYPLHFSNEEAVTIKTLINNPTDKEKILPLQWNQYAWDSQNEDNRRNTKTEVIVIPANSSKEVSYEVFSQRESVVYVTAVAQDGESKSFLNIRFVRDGVEETRINFPSITAFPLAKDTINTIFACAHSTNLPVVPGNTLTLTLTDKKGDIIHEYKYQGDITGMMAGFGEQFTPTKNYNYTVLTAKLEREGAVIEEVEIVYDCQVIDSSRCLPEDSSSSSFIDIIKQQFMNILLGVAVIALLGALYAYYRRHKKEHIVAGPFSLLFFLLLIPSLFLLSPHVSEAKSVMWSNGSIPDLFYCWNYGTNGQTDFCPTWTKRESGQNYVNWFRGLGGAAVDVSYGAEITNLDTGTLLVDNQSVAIGTKLRLATNPHKSEDIYWFGTGYSSDSPNGDWMPGAGPTGGQNETYWNFLTGQQLTTYSFCRPKDYVGGGIYAAYIPLSVNPPTGKTTTVSPTLSCQPASVDSNGTLTQDCTVVSAGNINIAFQIPATYGKFYYRYYHPGQTVGFVEVIAPGCKANATAMRTATYAPLTGHGEVRQGGLSGSDYILNVPAQSITFNFSAVSGNNPPATPTITGATSGNSNVSYPFNFTASDGDGDTLRYGIDWDNNGSVDEWAPGSGHVPSGTQQSSSRSWASNGTFTFQVLAQDFNGANSGWATHSIALSPAVISSDLTINGSNGPLNVVKGSTLTIAWTSANAATCTKFGANWGSGQGVALSGSESVAATVSDTYLINCSGVVDSVAVTVVNQAPNAPVISGPTSANGGDTNTFGIVATDPDNDQIFYEIDWDNNGTVEVSSPGSGYINSGTSININRMWFAAGTYTFQARAVDNVNAQSGWTQHTITITSSVPATASIEASVNGGAWTTTDPTVNPGDSVSIRWNSSNATSCSGSGSGFNTGNATNGTDGVNTPAPNSSDTFTVNCTGPGGSNSDSIIVTTRQAPNFTTPLITFNPLAFNTTTATYDTLEVIFQTSNNGGSDTITSANYQFRFDRGSNGYDVDTSGSLGLLNVSASVNRTETVTNVPLGSNRIQVTIDSTNAVSEVDETDNVNTLDIVIPAPNPGLDIAANRTQVRSGETVTLTWTAAVAYPLNCKVVGPGVNVNPSGTSGNRLTQPITAKSEFTFSCVEPVTGTVFTDSVTVEAQGEIEEI